MFVIDLVRELFVRARTRSIVRQMGLSDSGQNEISKMLLFLFAPSEKLTSKILRKNLWLLTEHAEQILGPVLLLVGE